MFGTSASEAGPRASLVPALPQHGVSLVSPGKLPLANNFRQRGWLKLSAISVPLSQLLRLLFIRNLEEGRVESFSHVRHGEEKLKLLKVSLTTAEARFAAITALVTICG